MYLVVCSCQLLAHNPLLLARFTVAASVSTFCRISPIPFLQGGGKNRSQFFMEEKYTYITETVAQWNDLDVEERKACKQGYEWISKFQVSV